MLIFGNILIDRMFTIQNLDFHTYISGITFHRSTDTDSVIGSRCQLELETINKVPEFVLCIQVPTIALARYHGNTTVFHRIIYRVTSPLMHICSVKQ